MTRAKLFKVRHSSIGEKMAEAYSPRQAKLIVFLKHIAKGAGMTPTESARKFRVFSSSAVAVKIG